MPGTVKEVTSGTVNSHEIKFKGKKIIYSIFSGYFRNIDVSAITIVFFVTHIPLIVFQVHRGQVTHGIVHIICMQNQLCSCC